jgi:hypothetical protein
MFTVSRLYFFISFALVLLSPMELFTPIISTVLKIAAQHLANNIAKATVQLMLFCRYHTMHHFANGFVVLKNRLLPFNPFFGHNDELVVTPSKIPKPCASLGKRTELG